MGRIGGVLAAAVLAAWPAAAHAQLDLTRVSATPTLGNESAGVFHFIASRDGTRMVFSALNPKVTAEDARGGFYERAGGTVRRLFPTDDERWTWLYGASADAATAIFGSGNVRLSGDDTDDLADVYLTRGGAIEHLTPGPAEELRVETPVGLSGDGAVALFSSPFRRLPEDSDDFYDVYAWEAGTTTLVTPGTEGHDARLAGHSADARTLVISTIARMTPDDADDEPDLFMRRGGTTIKLSPGDGPHFAELSDISADGAYVLFSTGERLAAADTDDEMDVYRWSAAGIDLISGGNTPDADHRKWTAAFASEDGRRVMIHSIERLTSDDTDSATDVYVWEGGERARVSHGPNGGNADRITWDTDYWRPATASLHASSPDGSSIFFRTPESLTPDDTDGHWQDVYEWRAGEVRRVTTGPNGGNGAFESDECGVTYLSECGAGVAHTSRDGSRVIFWSAEPLVPADTDTAVDVYQRAGGVTTLLSPARPGVSLERHVNFIDASDDASVAFLKTEEALTEDDHDPQGYDVFSVRPPAAGTALGDLSGPGPGDAGAPAPPVTTVVPPTVTTPPALKAADVVTVPSTKRCVTRRRLRIRLRTPRGTKITRVTVFINGRKKRTFKGSAIRPTVELRRLPKDRFTLRIVIKTADGRTAKLTRRYRTCAPRRTV